MAWYSTAHRPRGVAASSHRPDYWQCKVKKGQGCGFQFNKAGAEVCSQCNENWNFSKRGHGTTTPRASWADADHWDGYSSAPWNKTAVKARGQGSAATQPLTPGFVQSRHHVQWSAEEVVEVEDDGAFGSGHVPPTTPTTVGIKNLRAAVVALKKAKCEPHLLAHAAADLEAAEEAVRRAVPPHMQIRVLHNSMHAIGVKLGALHTEWEQMKPTWPSSRSDSVKFETVDEFSKSKKQGFTRQVDMLETANGIRPAAHLDDTQDMLVCKLLGVGDISLLPNSPLLQQLAEIIGQVKHTLIPECRAGSSEDVTMEPKFKFGSVPMPTHQFIGTLYTKCCRCWRCGEYSSLRSASTPRRGCNASRISSSSRSLGCSLGSYRTRES